MHIYHLIVSVDQECALLCWMLLAQGSHRLQGRCSHLQARLGAGGLLSSSRLCVLAGLRSLREGSVPCHMDISIEMQQTFFVYREREKKNCVNHSLFVA